jgi:hypothetical protein
MSQHAPGADPAKPQYRGNFGVAQLVASARRGPGDAECAGAYHDEACRGHDGRRVSYVPSMRRGNLAARRIRSTVELAGLKSEGVRPKQA